MARISALRAGRASATMPAGNAKTNDSVSGRLDASPTSARGRPSDLR
ncbi:MAG: hypothetical protein QXJ59_04315 [Thermofilaceae archaeon]